MTTTDQLDPRLRTIGELFDDDGAIYTVPVYQRNYSWQAEQIEQLISDIQDAIDEKEAGYFLGNLIVTERGSSTTPDFEVIDGQQRLTTLYLLLTVLADTEARTYTAHKERLRFESRPRATEALRHITVGSSRRHATPAADGPSGEDAGIHQGLNVIRQFMDQHAILRDAPARDVFADYLRTKVTVVRASLPAGTDLNRYFEIMNTRGQQLRQVDIVKARLMSHLPDEAQRACFAWIWDACSEMDSYVQMSLTRGRTELRQAAFGADWSWLVPTTFDQLVELRGRDQPSNATLGSTGTSLTIEAVLATYAADGTPEPGQDDDNVRFRSTIEFPALLLHVLKIVDRDSGEDEGKLDDKRLVKRFDQAVRGDKSAWVQDFAFQLLRCRNLFDAFVVKRQYTASDTEGDWSLQKLIRGVSNGKVTPRYVHSFSTVRAAVEDDGEEDSTTSDVLLLESMLRVTYTSPRTMHWITQLLRLLAERQLGTVSGPQVVELLQGHAREKVDVAFSGEEPTGFGLARIVFTYLDYLLLQREPRPGFRFAFRNSIEHFYPQHPDEQQVGEVVSSINLNLLGNLALVSVGTNSKFSNSLPLAKAVNFRSTIETQSPKLHLMAEITRLEGWGDAQVQRHHDDVVATLRADIAMRTQPPVR